MVSSPMFSYLLSKPARAMLIFWCLHEAQALWSYCSVSSKVTLLAEWLLFIPVSISLSWQPTQITLNQPQFAKVCDEQVCLTDEDTPLHLMAAPFSPPCIQGDLNISTTYSETVFEKCLISPEFGPEWLGTLLSQDLFPLFSVLAGILTLMGF